jgi:hypothetical protein
VAFRRHGGDSASGITTTCITRRTDQGKNQRCTVGTRRGVGTRKSEAIACLAARPQTNYSATRILKLETTRWQNIKTAVMWSPQAQASSKTKLITDWINRLEHAVPLSLPPTELASVKPSENYTGEAPRGPRQRQVEATDPRAIPEPKSNAATTSAVKSNQSDPPCIEMFRTSTFSSESNRRRGGRRGRAGKARGLGRRNEMKTTDETIFCALVRFGF